MITNSLLLLDPWSVSYSPSVSVDVVVTSQSYGLRDQGKLSDRVRYEFSGTREFTGNNADDKLAFFEYYVREELKRGTNKFIDRYIDQNGLKQGVMIIQGGNYSVASDGVSHTVTCNIEVFRNA